MSAQTKSAIYQTNNGTLFVPSDQQRRIHDQAKSREPGLHSPIPGLGWQWRNRERFRRTYPWFDPWIVQGIEPPSDVTVVTKNQADRCSKAWDFRAFCQGFVRHRYTEWLRNKTIPSLEWLKWLFGEAAPDGSFVIEPPLQRLRPEKSQKGICKAAGLSETVVWLWKNNPAKNEILPLVLEAAASPGKSFSSLDKFPGWSKLNLKTRRCMWEYARAATLASCCKRAGISVARFYSFLRQAQRLGVQESLVQYLAGKNKRWNRLTGLISENLFLPSANIYRFRQQARREAARQNIRFFKNLPGFDLWFQDSVIPRQFFGRRFRFAENNLTQTNGAIKNGRSALKGSVVHIYNPQSVSLHGNGSRRKKKIGRRRESAPEILRRSSNKKPGREGKRGRKKGSLNERTQAKYRAIREAFEGGEKNRSALARRFTTSRRSVDRALESESG